MEIGAAFEGYEMALKEVTKMIAEGKTTADIMQFVSEVTGT